MRTDKDFAAERDNAMRLMVGEVALWENAYYRDRGLKMLRAFYLSSLWDLSPEERRKRWDLDAMQVDGADRQRAKDYRGPG